MPAAAPSASARRRVRTAGGTSRRVAPGAMPPATAVAGAKFRFVSLGGDDGLAGAGAVGGLSHSAAVGAHVVDDRQQRAPFRVSAYSTRGGTSGNVWRSTMPSSSSARRRSESVRGLMPASERSSSQKRERPSARSRTSRRVHLPQTISAVAQTGQVSSHTPKTLPNEAGDDQSSAVRAGCRARLPRRRRRCCRRQLRRGPRYGCTSTQPEPLKAIWTVSPDPRPVRFLTILKSVRIEVETPSDQVIAACASAKVGRAGDVEHHGRAVGDDRDPAAALQRSC